MCRISQFEEKVGVWAGLELEVDHFSVGHPTSVSPLLLLFSGNMLDKLLAVQSDTLSSRLAPVRPTALGTCPGVLLLRGKAFAKGA